MSPLLCGALPCDTLKGTWKEICAATLELEENTQMEIGQWGKTAYEMLMGSPPEDQKALVEVNLVET